MISRLRYFLNVINETTGTGKFVGVRFSDETTENLAKWMAENDLPKPDKSEFHTTIVLDKNDTFPWKPKTFDPPLEIDPSKFHMEIFGPDKNVLVIAYDCPELEKRHETARKEYDIPWDWDEYKPHVTIVTNFTGTKDDITPPNFPLVITHEYSQPFDNNPKQVASERRLFRRNRVGREIAQE